MKTNTIFILMNFVLTSLYANENWIKIEPLNTSKTPKKEAQSDINLSEIKPVNKMMKNVALIKELIKTTSKKKSTPESDKNWFILTNDSKE